MADKFRRAKVPRHVRIYHRQLKSEAWRHLSGSATKVLMALAMLEMGENNGEFFLSVRTAAEMTGLGKNAVNRAFHELQDKGFIYCAERGGFSRKTPHAACWGLTWAAGPKGSPNRAPSHAYEKWRPTENHDLYNGDNAVPELGTTTEKLTVTCPQFGDSEEPEMAENCRTLSVPKSGTHTSDQPLSPVRLGPEWRVGWWRPDTSDCLARLGFWIIVDAQSRQAMRAAISPSTSA